MEELTADQVMAEFYNNLPGQIYELCTKFGGEDLYTYLTSSDFFSAPATLNKHYSFEGGLAKHTLDVYFYLSRLCEIWQAPYSEATICKVAICHALAKADLYESYLKNVKVDGQWIQQPAYRIKEDRYMAGDLGFTSYMIASRYVDFTDEEIIAICNYAYLNEMDKHIGLADVLRKYPLVTLLFMAYTFATYHE